MDREEKTVIKLCIAAFVGIVLLVSSCSFVGSKIEVATGYRDSTIRKVSHHGIIWKTYEMESLGDGTRQVASDKSTSLVIETFDYTVPHELVSEIQDIPPGQRVRIHYRKNLATWAPNGLSRFIVTKVEVLK